MACIIRNSEGEVVGMTADNNRRSNLFDELNRRTPEIAQDAYAISQSMEFKDEVVKPQIMQHRVRFQVPLTERGKEVVRAIRRDVQVYITPATIRNFNEETLRLKELTNKYNNVAKEISQGNLENQEEFTNLQNEILDTYQEHIQEKVSKIRGVNVNFNQPYLGSWEGDYEPSLNMTLSISPNADTGAISGLLFDIAENTSQDAFILEERSEIEDRTPLTEFDEAGMMHYPQIRVIFDRQLTVAEKSIIAQRLKNKGVEEFSIDGDYFIVSIIDFNSETNEQKKEFYEKTHAAITAPFRGAGERVGTNKVKDIQEHSRKSKYVGARNEGDEQSQTREYNRSDLFEAQSPNINYQITEEQGAQNLDQESKAFNEVVDQLNKTFPDTKVHQLNSEQIDSKLKELGVSEEVRKQVIAWHGTEKNIKDNRLSVDNSKYFGELLSGLYFGERRVSQSFAGITPFGDIQETSKIFKVKIDDSTFPEIDMRGESPTTDEALQNILSQKEYEELLDKKRRGEIKGIRLINAVEHLYGESSSPTQYVVFDESVIENIKVYEGGLLRSIIDTLFQKGIEVTVNGFVHNGEVYLNTDNLNPETPIHEFAHIYNSWLKDNRPYTYQRGIELINEELTKENSEIKSVIDYVKETQPNLKGESLSEEILAQLIGERGVELINRNKKGGIVEWIKNVWDEIRNLLGLSSLSIEQVANLTVQDFAEMAATDLLRGEELKFENEAQEYFTREADRLPLTLAVFNTKPFQDLQGKRVKPVTIQQLLNKTGIKQIEKDLINQVLSDNYSGQKRINYDEFEATVRANIIPLERITTSSYASYGMDNLGDGNYGEAKTLILNSPIEHGVTGHFPADFKASGRQNIKYQPKQLNDNTWVAVEEGYESQANNNNIYQFVGTAGTKEAVDAWIKNYEKPLDRSINKGMFAHIRVWQDGQDFYVAELQSDYFQKINAKKNIKLKVDYSKLDSDFHKKVRNAYERLGYTYNKKTGEVKNPNNEVLDEFVPDDDFMVLASMEIDNNSEILEVKKKLQDVYKKDRIRLEEEALKNRPLQEKQFIASQKVWEQRMVREAIKEASLSGATSLRFPTPHTLSVIEGYISGNEATEAPYKILEGDSNSLKEGDVIDYLDKEYIIVEANENTIKIVEKVQDDYTQEIIDDIIAEKGSEQFIKENKINDDRYIYKGFHLGDKGVLYVEKVKKPDDYETNDKYFEEGLFESQNLTRFSYFEKYREEIEDVVGKMSDKEFSEFIEDVDTIQQEKVNLSLENASKDFNGQFELPEYSPTIDEITENVLDYTSSYKVVDNRVYSTEFEETLKQPNKYTSQKSDGFDIATMLTEEEQTVARKYEEIAKILKKERGDNFEVVTDENGFDWYETKITPEESQNPVVAFQVSKDFNEGVEAVDTSRSTQLTVVTDLSGNQTEVDSSSIITYETEVGPIHYIIDSNGDMEMVRIGEQAVPEVADSNYKLSTNVVEVNGYRTIQLLRGDELLGYVRTQPFEDGVEIERSLLTEGTQRGQGIGTKMYKLAIQDAIERGLPIYSDHSQTEAAKGVWNKLVEEGLAEFDTNTERFKVSPLPKSLDNNGEPSAKDVYEYINRKNSEGVKVTPQDRINIIKSLVGFNSTDELLTMLKNAFMPEGYFNPTVKSLTENGYTQLEANNILRNTSIQEQINDTILKIESLPEAISIDSETVEDIDFVTLDTNVIGKMQNENPFKVKQELVEELGGIKDEQVYNDKINDEGLEIAKDMFEEMSQYNSIEVMEFNEDGELINTPKNNTYELLNETMTEDENGIVTTSINNLLMYDDIVLETELELTNILLRQIVEDAVDVGVDLIGLEEVSNTKPIEETKLFLFNLIQTLEGNISIQEFSESYNEFFNINTEDVRVEKHKNIAPNSVIIKDKTKTAYEMYVDHGLLYMGSNVYKPVNNRQDVEALYDSMATHSEMFPPQVFEGVNMNNESEVRGAIVKYVNEISKTIESENLERASEYVLNHIYFNSTLNHEVYIKSIPEVNNSEYLTTTFIADFYKEGLREKIKESEKYKDFYDNFEISKRGIEYKSTDPISMMIAEEYINENLKNYFAIKKDHNTEELSNFNEEDILTVRDVVMNFPQAISKLNKPYEVIDTNTIIVENTTEPFVRVEEGLYEMIDGDGNRTYYTRLPVNTSPYIQKMSAILTPISIEERSSVVEEPNLVINQEYNKKSAKENLECS